MQEIDKYKRNVRYSEIYGAFVGTCPAFFRGIVSQDQDEFVATKELVKAIKFKIECMIEDGEPLPNPDNFPHETISTRDPIGRLDLCPTCGQRVVSFVDNRDYTNSLEEGLNNHR